MKVVIGESIPAFNRGEEAILRGIITVLRRNEDVKIVYCTEFLEEDMCVYGKMVDIYHGEYLPGSKITKFFKHISKGIYLNFYGLIDEFLPATIGQRLIPAWIQDYIEADVLLIGHDNLYINGQRVLADLMQIIFFRWKRKKIVSLGSSIGPFKGKKIMIRLSKILLNSFNYIVLREHYSASYLKEIGVTFPLIKVGGDLAFLMKKSIDEKNREIIKRTKLAKKEGKEILSISISRAILRRFFDACQTVSEKEDLMVELLIKILQKLSLRRMLFVVFINHVTGICDGDYQDDRIIHSRISNEILPEIEQMTVGNNLNAQQTKAIISETDVILASRTHAMIGAASVGTNVVALSYAGNYKTEGIIGEMMGLKDNIIRLDGALIGDVLIDSIISKIEVAFKEANYRKKVLIEKTTILKRKIVDSVQFLST